jgi:hypothetical protein
VKRARALVGLALALSLVGCGGGDGDGGDNDEGAGGRKKQTSAAPETSWIEGEPPAEIVDHAAQAMRGLADVTYEGEASFPFPTGARRARLKASATGDGSCEAVVRATSIGTMTIRVLGQTGYVRADVGTLTGGLGVPAADATLFEGRWLSGPAEEVMPGCSAEAFSYARSVDNSTCTKGKKGDVGGTPTIAITCDNLDGSTTMHISIAEVPLVLAVEGVEKGAPFRMTMVAHNTGLEIKQPPRRDVIDSTQLD